LAEKWYTGFGLDVTRGPAMRGAVGGERSALRADAAVPQVKSTTPQATAYQGAAFNGGTIRGVSDARNRRLDKCVHNFVQEPGCMGESSSVNLRKPVFKATVLMPKPGKCRQSKDRRGG